MNPGDLAQVKDDGHSPDSGWVGLVQWVNPNYPATAGLLINGELRVYDMRTLEPVNADN